MIVLWSCANIGRPSGGEKDTAGPEVIGAIPYPGTLYFNSKEVIFYFNEFLKPGSYRDEIFISPVPTKDPEITVFNKTLKIKFLSSLRENTTYVITLGTGIADFNEGNKMTRSYTYAFSTGAVLDSLKFSGTVNGMWSGKGEDEMKVMLFRADEIEGNEILAKRPEYVSVTDKSGAFDFQFLAPGQYKIYAVNDVDNNFQYTGPSEKIGVSANPMIDLNPEDSVPLKIDLITFEQDDEGPKVRSAKWANDYTVHVEFGEQIRTSYGADSLRVEVSDTVGTMSMPIGSSRFRHHDRRHLYLDSPMPRTKDLKLHFYNLMDSLGHKRDTVVRVAAASQVKEEKAKWFAAPINLPHDQDFMVPAYFKLPETIDTSMVHLMDTAKLSQPIQLQVVGFHLLIKPLKLLDPAMVYQLELGKQILKPDGKPLDTLVKVKMKFPNPDEFGTISGKILPDSTRPDMKFVVIFKGGPGSAVLVPPIEPAGGGNKRGAANKGGDADAATNAEVYEQRFIAPASFKFIYLQPGKYSLDIIEDLDGNGVLTPGSLNPYRLPEKVYHQEGIFEIRAKWDFNNVEVYPIPAQGKPEAEGKGKSEKDPAIPNDDAPKSPKPNPKGGK